MQELIDTVVAYKTGIIGAILASCFAAYLTWRNGHKARTATACATFRAAVLAEFVSVYPNPAPWPNDIDRFLRARYPALQIAVENFRFFVPWWRRLGFNHAWRSFYNANPSGYDHERYDHYVETLPYVKGSANVRAVFHANVEHLLSYAKET